MASKESSREQHGTYSATDTVENEAELSDETYQWNVLFQCPFIQSKLILVFRDEFRIRNGCVEVKEHNRQSDNGFRQSLREVCTNIRVHRFRFKTEDPEDIKYITSDIENLKSARGTRKKPLNPYMAEEACVKVTSRNGVDEIQLITSQSYFKRCRSDVEYILNKHEVEHITDENGVACSTSLEVAMKMHPDKGVTSDGQVGSKYNYLAEMDVASAEGHSVYFASEDGDCHPYLGQHKQPQTGVPDTPALANTYYSQFDEDFTSSDEDENAVTVKERKTGLNDNLEDDNDDDDDDILFGSSGEIERTLVRKDDEDELYKQFQYVLDKDDDTEGTLTLADDMEAGAFGPVAREAKIKNLRIERERMLGDDGFKRAYDYLKTARYEKTDDATEEDIMSGLRQFVKNPSDCFLVDQLLFLEEQHKDHSL